MNENERKKENTANTYKYAFVSALGKIAKMFQKIDQEGFLPNEGPVNILGMTDFHSGSFNFLSIPRFQLSPRLSVDSFALTFSP